MKKYFVLLLFSIFIFSYSCKKELSNSAGSLTLNLPENTFDYNQKAPRQLFDTIDNHKATLGRVLFYDKNLSVNKSIACASCHKQHLGFSDNKAFSKGVNVAQTLRNTPPIVNLAYYGSFFWDNREDSLEAMVLMPIQDHIEMGFNDLEQMIFNLKGQSYYDDLFRRAFSTPDINSDRVGSALAEYLRGMFSSESKYEIGKEIDFSNFSSRELVGKEVFFDKAKCSNCHSSTNLDGGSRVANIGLNLNYEDKGVGALRDEIRDYGKFKVPGLRNIALTAPYMHDGRFKTLEEVIQHYNNGVVQHQNVDWRLTTSRDSAFALRDGFDGGWWEEPENGGKPLKLNLSEYEIECLIAFLNTLTDHQYINAERYSNPFR